MDELSVFIRVRNAAKWLPACLDSLLRQDYHNWRLVVVFDGQSTDHTEAIITAFSHDHPDHFDKYFIMIWPVGMGESYNVAHEGSDAPLQTQVDADDVLLTPDALSSVVAPFADQKIGVVMTHRLLIDETGLPLIQQPPKQPSAPPTTKEWLNSIGSQPLHCLRAFRRESVNVAGGWASGMTSAAAYDLTLRAICVEGIGCAVVPRNLYGWRQHPEQQTKTNAKKVASCMHLARLNATAAIAAKKPDAWKRKSPRKALSASCSDSRRNP